MHKTQQNENHQRGARALSLTHTYTNSARFDTIKIIGNCETKIACVLRDVGIAYVYSCYCFFFHSTYNIFCASFRVAEKFHSVCVRITAFYPILIFSHPILFLCWNTVSVAIGTISKAHSDCNSNLEALKHPILNDNLIVNISGFPNMSTSTSTSTAIKAIPLLSFSDSAL